MSQFVEGFKKTLIAGEDLSAKEFYIGQLDASGNLEVAEGATDLVVGVIRENAGGSGASATYQFLGTAKVKLGGTVAIGDWVTTDSAGKGVATTTDGNITIGRALEAGVDGDIIEVQLNVQHLYIA